MRNKDMNAIELMNEEHKNILRIIKVVRKVCFNIMKGTEINYKDLEDIIEFIRNYADSHHYCHPYTIPSRLWLAYI